MDFSGQKIGPDFEEIFLDPSKISMDLREIQKTVQNYGNSLYGVPQIVDAIFNKQDVILDILKDIQKRVEKLEAQPCSSRAKKGFFSDEPKDTRYQSKMVDKRDPRLDLITIRGEKI